ELAHPQRDLAGFGELAGIAQEIEQDLSQPHGVDDERAETAVSFDDEAVLILLGELARGADNLVNEAHQIHRLRAELELARFDLGKIVHLINEAEEMGAGAMHAIERLERL